jgi:CRP-like cAMP-binding protein
MFSDCQPQTVLALVQKLQPQVLVPGQVIYRKGDRGDQIYFLVFGRTVQYLTRGMAIELHGHINEGETFGELAFFEENSRHAMSMVRSELCDIIFLIYFY